MRTELALSKYCRRESLPNRLFERNVVWTNAIFGSYCNDCHQWLSHSFTVHQIRFGHCLCICKCGFFVWYLSWLEICMTAVCIAFCVLFCTTSNSSNRQKRRILGSKVIHCSDILSQIYRCSVVCPSVSLSVGHNRESSCTRNKCIAVRKVATPLRELTCHMRSHSVTCHPAEVTFPPLPQPKLVLD